jgi:hypothetical protein
MPVSAGPADCFAALAMTQSDVAKYGRKLP